MRTCNSKPKKELDPQYSFRFTFGKYQGTGIKTVMAFNPSYIVWAFENTQQKIPENIYHQCKEKLWEDYVLMSSRDNFEVNLNDSVRTN